MIEQDGFWVFLISAGIIISFFLLCLAFWIGWRMTQRSQSVSPYTGIPLRSASDIPYSSAEKIMRFLFQMRQYDNRIFRLSRSVFCRETGRIFQECVTWFGVVRLDWSFLQKRYPGHYVSWGSLSREQQEDVRKAHSSLEGFQTEQSCPLPIPRAIESDYVYTKPGPLYVDFEAKTLLGWKEVPGTDFEVLIVQKPTK